MKPQPIDPRLGQRLRQLRESRDMSQGQLAKAIGVSIGTVQNYEHGRVHMTVDRLEQFAQALQCETVDLLAEPGSPPPRYRRPFDRSGGSKNARCVSATAR
jgi:transcriptional regulator with XRE-family HTH domain